MYSRILVPTDGSEHAEVAADRAIDLGVKLDAELFVCTVVESGPLGSFRLPGDAGSAEEMLSEEARRIVEGVAARARERDVAVTTAVRSGVAVEDVVEYAQDIDADLVVMGSHGRGGFDRLVLGSVTDGVIRRSPTDVLVIDGGGGQ